MRRKTDEQFKQEVFSLVKDEYTFIEPYVNSYTKIKVKHNKCGNVYEVKPNKFISGNRCPYCYGNVKKTNIQFQQEVHALVGDEYVFLDTYVNNYTKIRVKHNKCGNIYEVKPMNFIHGRRCPYCGSSAKKTNTQFRQEVYILVGNEYVFLDTYVNNYTKIRVKHNKCGNVYEVQPSSFIRGKRCPYCAGLAKKTDKQFKHEVFNLVNNDYTFLDKYVNNKTKLRVKHNGCGNVYEVQPNSFLSGKRCPYCNQTPKGETFISKILDNLNINYEYQKTFDDLRDSQPLSYDFYIPDQNILIEYQGLQHYQPIDYFGGDDRFISQQKHDKMKLDYAKEHGYNLITVPYTEDSLSKIKKYLIKHGLNYKEKLWEY